MKRIECPSCAVAVNVPDDKIGGSARCPKCQAHLFPTPLKLPGRITEAVPQGYLDETPSEAPDDLVIDDDIPATPAPKATPGAIESRLDLLNAHAAEIKRMLRLFYYVLVTQLVLAGMALIIAAMVRFVGKI